MEHLPQFISLGIIALLGAMSPGADFVLVTRNSFVYSRKVGVFTAMGIGLGILVHVFYTLAGIGLIISQSILLFSLIKYAGAAYLIYIGWNFLKAKKQKEIDKSAETSEVKKIISPLKAVGMGVGINTLNPKVTLFFLSLFVQFISPGTPLGIQIALGLETALIVGVWFVLIALMFSNNWLKVKIRKSGHWFERIMGGALILLGIKVALSTKN
jgi:RhtB (resistance to homoserine/threonine) family protein